MSEQLETLPRPAAMTGIGEPHRPSRWGHFPPPPSKDVVHQVAANDYEYGLLGKAAALCLLILVLPVFLLVAVAIKIESPGGAVFYRQERVGLDRRKHGRRRAGNGNGTPYRGRERRIRRGFGRTFRIWKFRTMIPDAEAKSGPVWALTDDPRVTRVGRVLRHLRLDELPQLMNVVAGEMNLIGPRPEREHFVEKLSSDLPSYEGRLAVLPGITGLAQVEREYDTDILDVRTKLKYDLFYVQNRSRLMDFKILVKTVDVMLRGRGAR